MAAPGHAAQPDPSEDPALAVRVRQLEARLAAVESRLAALAGAPVAAAPAALPAASAALAPASARSYLALAGRLCLVFAGAYLVRSLTDAGAVPKGAGVALGLAYAGAWAGVADRAAAKGKATQASALTIAAALIGFPLLWEATIGFKVLAAPAAAALLAGLAAALMAVAWRGSLHGAAWVVTLGALATGFALMIATAAVEAFSWTFLLLGGALLWLTYGRRWQDLRWPVALATDAGVLIVAVLAAWPGGAPEAYRGLGSGRAMALALCLVLVYLGSFVVRILRRHRALIVFEGVQGALALLVGFGGALRIAQATGAGAPLLGVAALLAGFACYAAAFAFVEQQSEGGGNFAFFTSLALVLVAVGCLVLLAGDGRTWVFVCLGLAATLLGLRHRRWTLLAHGAAYLTASALVSELVPRAFELFLLPAGPARTPLTAPILVSIVVLGAVHGMLARPADPQPWLHRLPSFVAGLWATLGLGALALAGLIQLLPGSPPEASALAAVRTSVLAASAAALAALGRLLPRTELRWLVYPVLGLAGLKLLIADLPLGRPLTLFPSLAVIGAALLLAPRLLRGTGATDEGGA